MKKFFSIVFTLGIIAAFAMQNPALGAASVVGLSFTANTWVSEYSFLQIVPGKYVTANGQEVPYMSRAEKALFDQLITLGRSNSVTRQAIESGAVSFDPISYYIRAIVTAGAGRQKIVGQNLLNSVGTTNFPNGAQLPQYYNFCFDRIAIRYATTNSANASAQAITGWSSVRGNMPAALANGEIIISSNRNTIVETPISDFTTVASTTAGGERDYDGGVLEKPRFFLEMLQIEVELNYASGQAVPSVANNTYAVEVMFYGVQARLKY
jgi:hypothetical protein